MPRQGSYTDNAMNRSLGRVGMAYGTAVHSRSTGSSYSGMSTSSSSPGTYVDNAMNRSLGRVGMDYGTAVHSRSSGLSYSGSSMGSSVPKTYVDNAANRAQGRVGMPYGAAVSSPTMASTGGSSGFNSATVGKTQPDKRTYADNAYNRRLGRVGKELGTHVVSKSDNLSLNRSTTTVPAKLQKTYVDNAINRKLGRVGMPLGSMPCSTASKPKAPKALFPWTFEQINQGLSDSGVCSDMVPAYKEIECRRQLARERDDAEILQQCDQIEGILNRCEAAKSFKRSHPPSWLKSGDVIDYAELEVGDRVGGGGFGDVHTAIWKDEMVCIKVLRVQRVREQKRMQFESEVKQFSSLNHPAVVSFYGACVITPKLAIVMEFMQRGSLHDAIHIMQTPFKDSTKFQLANDMLSALEYIHGLNTVHRDIKSSNVLLCDDLLHCKLSDFGLALKEEVETNSSVADHSVVGTLKYCPFEVLEGERLTVSQFKAVDVYSTAVTILELMVEKMPFDGMNQHEVRKAVKNCENKDLELLDSSSLKNLLARCLDKQSINRPSASQFKKLIGWQVFRE